MQCDDRLDDGIGRITGDLCRRSMCEFFVGCSGRLSVLARCAAGLCGLRPVPSHSASIPHAFAPAALRASLASRGSAPGPSPPRDAWRPCKSAEPASAGSAWPAPRRDGLDAAHTPGLAEAGCANACRPRRWRFSPVTSRRTVHGHNARPSYGTSTPRLKTDTARCGRGFLVSRWSVDLARVRERVGEAFVRGCRVGHNSFRSGSAQGVLVSL